MITLQTSKTNKQRGEGNHVYFGIETMSTAAHTTRHSITSRTVHAGRRVVVPDRMIVKAGTGISPMINKQLSATPPQLGVAKKHVNVRHQPLASSKVHKTLQKDFGNQAVRPLKRQVETAVVTEMGTYLERHKALPKHLARTASRAHLLSQLVQPEPRKLRWHQKILAGIMS